MIAAAKKTSLQNRTLRKVEVLCNYFMLATLYEMIEETFQLTSKNGFHVKTENERFR